MHNKIGGPLVEIGPHSVFDNSAVGSPAVASREGSAHDLTPLVAAVGGERREKNGQWPVVSEDEGRELAVIAAVSRKRQNEAIYERGLVKRGRARFVSRAPPSWITRDHFCPRVPATLTPLPMIRL